MAATFYSRYIPPGKDPLPIPSAKPEGSDSSRKRKREGGSSAGKAPRARGRKTGKGVVDESGTPYKGDPYDADSIPQSKRKVDLHQISARPEKGHSSPSLQTKSTGRSSEEGGSRPKKSSAEMGQGPSESCVSAARTAILISKPIRVAAGDAAPSKGDGDGTVPSHGRKQPRSGDGAVNSENGTPAKHTRILSKFEKTRKTQQAISGKLKTGGRPSDCAENTISPVTHDLEPLPQPAPAPESNDQPTYSTLPPWLSQPLVVSPELQVKFSALGVSPKVLSVLEGQGYQEAFPIQSAVIPLLSKGPDQHPGDLCISAATGSGKTLAYVLPLIAGVECSAVTRLRGLIVVPTRELVRQLRDVCELFATGTGLRVGTAIGSTPLKEEQSVLMGQSLLFDPFAYKMLQDQSMTSNDWANFSLLEYMAEIDGCDKTLLNHVSTSMPNIDILICTPGRLVDHIRSTSGFTLEHLQWLVIDEADRLLNESFQEWVEILLHALSAKKSFDLMGRSEKLLYQLQCAPESREPQKIILSATMTRDISKLNSLRLQNPKLVVVGSAETAALGQGQTATFPETPDRLFTLPSTLEEYFVPVGDGSEKPLYLLELLLSHANLDINESVSNTRRQRHISDKTTSNSKNAESFNRAHNSLSDSSPTPSDTSSDTSSTSSDSSSDSIGSEKATLDSARGSELGETSRSTILIFTKSSESASRLSRLLILMCPSLEGRLGTLTKSDKSSTSRKTLSAYRRGKLSIITATDRASRGLDLPDISHVVNYDVPTSLTTYVHRVGRTARAGRTGSAVTLVAHREGRWFANEIARDAEGRISRHGKVERLNIKVDKRGDDWREIYSHALSALEKEVTEDRGWPNSKKSRS